jgi:hypothetical protein
LGTGPFSPPGCTWAKRTGPQSCGEGATVYEFRADGPSRTTWAEIDTVHITMDFLNDPMGFLAELLADDPD